MMRIQSTPKYSDVMFAFPPKLRYFAEVEAANGEVFCAYEGAAPVGIVCLRSQPHGFDTAYLYTAEAKRRQGVAAGLMRHAAAYAAGQGKPLCFRILQHGGSASACVKIADRLGFAPCGEAVFFSLEVNAETKQLWEAYRPKLVEKIARVEKKTGRHEIATFANAGETVLKRLREKIGRSLPGSLNPFLLPDFNPSLSLIVLRRGEPVAFHAVRTVGQKIICEISAAEQGSTLSPAFPVFFDTLFDSEITRATAMVYSGNAAGMNHVRRFGFLFQETNRQIVCMFHKKTKGSTEL